MSTHKPRAYSINDFISWNDRNELILQPKFQRRDVWSIKAKSHLIDTILRGLPIPIIFIRQSIEPRQRRTIREVVDGQQRLRSVISFSKDEFVVLRSQNPSFGGLTYSQLPSEVQDRFLNYEFSVALLEGATDAEVLDIFARLNTYALTLTSQELLNADFFGQFKQTAFSLGYDHLEFWRENGILQNKQIIRMAEAELTSELLVTMLIGIQHRRSKIKELYTKYDDEFADKERIEREFKSVIDKIAECFGPSLKGSIYTKRIIFHSLFCAFYHVMYGIPSTIELPNIANRRLASDNLKMIKENLNNLEMKYKRTPLPDELKNFYEACQKGTADREKRIERTKVIVEYMVKRMDNIS